MKKLKKKNKKSKSKFYKFKLFNKMINIRLNLKKKINYKNQRKLILYK